jgi:hypothetical protein
MTPVDLLEGTTHSEIGRKGLPQGKSLPGVMYEEGRDYLGISR